MYGVDRRCPGPPNASYRGAVRKMTRIDDELLRIMVCPVAHAPLVQVGDWLYSTDPQTRRNYPIRDGIPIMLVEEAQVAEPEEFERAMTEANRLASAESEEPKRETK